MCHACMCIESGAIFRLSERDTLGYASHSYCGGVVRRSFVVQLSKPVSICPRSASKFMGIGRYDLKATVDRDTMHSERVDPSDSSPYSTDIKSARAVPEEGSGMSVND